MSELIHNFGIDWKLLVTQAINFFILLLVLRRFAYKPILKMLEKRRRDIEAGIRMKKEAEIRLNQIEQERQTILEESRKESLVVLARAELAGKERKEEIVKEANQKAENLINEAKKIIREERAKMGEGVYKEASGLIRLGLAKVLFKMPPKDRDEVLIKEALAELKKT